MHVTEKKYHDLLKQKFGDKLIKFERGENFFLKISNFQFIHISEVLF